MNQFFLVFCFVLIMGSVSAQNQSLIMDLYPGEIPFQKVTQVKEVSKSEGIVRISNVQTPQIQVFLPSKSSANGQAVIICPGGGYGILAYDWEGTDIAKWLNSHGIAGIVLKYRLPSAITQTSPHLVPMSDGQQAIRLVRHHAEEWNIDPDKIGIMGFSAGGHLASTLGTHFDSGNPGSDDPILQQSCRPDFMILGYPVISFNEKFTHIGSRNSLIGKTPEARWVNYFSNEEQIRSDTPPTFIFHSQDDTGVPVKHSLMFYEGLVAKKIPVEMHLYPLGQHGYSLSLNKEGTQKDWPNSCINWMKHLQ